MERDGKQTDCLHMHGCVSGDFFFLLPGAVFSLTAVCSARGWFSPKAHVAHLLLGCLLLAPTQGGVLASGEKSDTTPVTTFNQNRHMIL